MIDSLNINNDYLTFLFIPLKVQDIHCLLSKSIPFTFFVIFFEVLIWNTRFSHHNIVARPYGSEKSRDITVTAQGDGERN